MVLAPFARLRPGPAFALLFALGIALNRSWMPDQPGIGPPASSPLLRWLTGTILLLLAALPPVGPRSRPALAGLLALVLGALRGAGAAPADAEKFPEGPLRLEAWVSEVPVTMAPVPPAGPPPDHPSRKSRTSFHTADPSLLVSIAGAVPWIDAGHLLSLEGRILPSHQRWNPGDPPPGSRPPTLAIEERQCVRAAGYQPFQRPIEGAILLLRERAHRLLERLYPPGTSGFLIAMLLGDRRLLPDEYRLVMSRTGTIHFLAISGLNVGMAMALVVRLPLPARIRLAARLAFLLVFTLVTGGAPPVARAAVMLAIQCLGDSLGRATRPLDTLSWASLIILAVEPAWAFDVGFQLSVAAVFAMIAWAPALTGRGSAEHAGPPEIPPLAPRSRLPRLLEGALRAARRPLGVSIATSAGTAPLILLFFYRVHPLGPLWNLLVGPLVDGILLLGGASLALGSIHPSLAAPPAWITERLSRVLLYSLTFFSRAPGSCVYLPPPPLWAAIAAQILIALGACPGLRRWALGGALLLGCTLGAGTLFWPGPPRLLVLDVGGASSALLKIPEAGSYLFDCGASEGTRWAGERIGRAILASGVRRLSGVVLSHPHADHLSGLLDLAEIVPPGKVWVSPLFERFPLGRWLLGELAARGIPVEVISRGQRIRCAGGLELEVLHPSEGEELRLVSSPNDGSLVVRALWKGSAILFPGDIEEAGTARLLGAGDDLRSDLLVLPHHGRSSSLLADLVRRVGPRSAVICGDGAGGGRESALGLRREGIDTAGTWERGAILCDWQGRWRLAGR